MLLEPGRKDVCVCPVPLGSRVCRGLCKAFGKKIGNAEGRRKGGRLESIFSRELPMFP